MSTSTAFPKKVDLAISKLLHDFKVRYGLSLTHDSIFQVNHPSSRMWTRGDGQRYREPGEIRLYKPDKLSKKLALAFDRYLCHHPLAKDIPGGVGGALTSEPRIKGVRIGPIYIRFDVPQRIYTFGSLSRLKTR